VLHGLEHKRVVIHAAEGQRRVVGPEAGDDAGVPFPRLGEPGRELGAVHRADHDQPANSPGAQDAIEAGAVELGVVEPEGVDAVPLRRRPAPATFDVGRYRRMVPEGVPGRVGIEKREGVPGFLDPRPSKLRHEVRDHGIDRISGLPRGCDDAFAGLRGNLGIVPERQRNRVLRHAELPREVSHGGRGHGGDREMCSDWLDGQVLRDSGGWRVPPAGA
jgi:hypothetical protein